MAEVITLRLDKGLVRDLNELSEAEQKDRSAVVRQLLQTGVHEHKILAALRQYSAGKVTLWKAARLAGLSLWEMSDVLVQKKIEVQYTMSDLQQDLKSLERV